MEIKPYKSIPEIAKYLPLLGWPGVEAVLYDCQLRPSKEIPADKMAEVIRRLGEKLEYRERCKKGIKRAEEFLASIED